MCTLSFSWAYCYRRSKEDQAGKKKWGLDTGQVTNCVGVGKGIHDGYLGTHTYIRLAIVIKMYINIEKWWICRLEHWIQKIHPGWFPSTWIMINVDRIFTVNLVLCVFFFFRSKIFIYSFESERERVSEADSPLSTEPDAGPKPTTVRLT